MKSLVASLVIVVLLVIGGVAYAKSPRIKKPTVPVIKIDDAHYQIERPGKTPPSAYTVAPCDEIELDATGYMFQVPQQYAGKSLNSIQIILGQDAMFEMDWIPGTTRYRIAADTVRTKAGTKFHGLREGDKLILGVGILIPGTPNPKFAVAWTGMVDVTAATTK